MTLHDQPIRSREEGEAYIRALVDNDAAWHFDDDPSEMIDLDGCFGFTPEELPLMRQRVAELYAVDDWGDYGCPLGCLREALAEKEAADFAQQCVRLADGLKPRTDIGNMTYSELAVWIHIHGGDPDADHGIIREAQRVLEGVQS